MDEFLVVLQGARRAHRQVAPRFPRAVMRRGFTLMAFPTYHDKSVRDQVVEAFGTSCALRGVRSGGRGSASTQWQECLSNVRAPLGASCRPCEPRAPWRLSTHDLEYQRFPNSQSEEVR